MLIVCTYLWTPDTDSKYSVYRPEDVRLLQHMVAQHLSVPHQFVVVTDRPASFSGDRKIRAVPIDWTTHVPRTCFARLHTFSPKAKEDLGERVLRLDLDTVVVGNLDPLIDREEDLVLWRNPARWWAETQKIPYRKEPPYGFWNGSMLLHRTGSMTHLWSRFDAKAPSAIDDDQYLSDVLGRDVPYWDQGHGVYRLENGHPRWRGCGVETNLPDNARIVFFPGAKKAHLPTVIEQAPWIVQHRM